MIERDVELIDGTIVLRPASPDDAPRLYVAIRESLADLSPWMSWACNGHSIEDTQTWLDMQPEQWTQDRAYEFVIRDAATGDVLGACGLNNVNRAFRKANLGYWVHSDHTGRGHATLMHDNLVTTSVYPGPMWGQECGWQHDPASGVEGLCPRAGSG